ncbi:hypothetical protein ABFV51_27260 [Pseudomonas asgharzadehiana]|uniref:hypothetical protein n=1 Tax=Pseudomonas asgharzadehiana TaxID=2842349 RepID=UPI0034D59D55
MINFEALLKAVPATPSFQGSWASVYLEPMMASGERLTVAVAAIGKNGECRVSPAIRPHVIDAMFGAQAAGMAKMIGLICSSLQHHLQYRSSFDGWISPMSGVSLGRVRETSSADLVGLLRQAVSMTASLAALDFSDADSEIDEVDGVDVGLGSNRDPWPKLFESAVVQRDARLSGYFNRTFEVSEKARPAKIFYLSERAAINTGKLIPGAALSGMFERNKARLLDLLVVRDRDDKLFPRAHFELVVFRPAFDDPTYSERQIDSLRRSIEALEEAGDKHELRVQAVQSPEEAADRLLQSEAA